MCCACFPLCWHAGTADQVTYALHMMYCLFVTKMSLGWVLHVRGAAPTDLPAAPRTLPGYAYVLVLLSSHGMALW